MIEMVVGNLIVEALIKTGVTKTVDLAFKGVEKLFWAAIERGDSTKATEILTGDPALQEDLAEVATGALQEAVIIPMPPSAGITPDQKLQLFLEVIKAGIAISTKLRSDIPLPGSILGTHTVTLFSSNAPFSFEQKDSLIRLDLIWGAGMIILPSDNPIDSCNGAIVGLRQKRELSDGYLEMASLLGSPYQIEDVTNMSVTYARGESMSEEEGVALGLTAGAPKTMFDIARKAAPVRDWYEGIRMMLDFMPKLPSINVLPADQGDQVRDLSERVSKLDAFQLNPNE